jgi:hypothetical protein
MLKLKNKLMNRQCMFVPILSPSNSNAACLRLDAAGASINELS